MNESFHQPGHHSTRRVLLGLFILGQLFFLVSSNLIGFLKDNRKTMSAPMRRVVETVAPGWADEKGHLWHLMEHLGTTDKMWAQATGQTQIWKLFAPAIDRECVFPALELHWDAKPTPELILAENEPADLEHYFRYGDARLRRYENNLVIALQPLENETPTETNRRFRDKIQKHVADYADILEGYLRWRIGQAMERRPGRDHPQQAILILRRYHINDYEDAPPFWSGPFSVPIARLQPGSTLEWYDPVTQQFQGLDQ